MSNCVLKTFCELQGIGAASGLVMDQGYLYIVSDQSSYLYQYHIQTQQLNRIGLVENSQHISPKKDKFDLESVVKKDNSLYLFGSGSTQKRHQLFHYELKSQHIQTVDLSSLYHSFKQVGGLSDDELNIEGVIYDAPRWLFFQRGNGASAQNGIFIAHSEHLEHQASIEFIPFQLPLINQVLASFTDAILVNQQIYFLAAVENSQSTYDDGEVLGSFIGCIDLAQLKLNYIEQITDSHKFEGLAFYQQTQDELILLLCEDNDSDELSTTIYQLNMRLPLISITHHP